MLRRLLLLLVCVALCSLCCSCEAILAAARSIGIPLGPGASGDALAVDQAIVRGMSNWVAWLLGIGTTEVPRAAVKLHRHRKAKKAAKAANAVVREKIVGDLMQKAAAKAGIAPPT